VNGNSLTFGFVFLINETVEELTVSNDKKTEQLYQQTADIEILRNQITKLEEELKNQTAQSGHRRSLILMKVSYLLCFD
jgi:peptidoglycan hydrolase CwlO-like protein